MKRAVLFLSALLLNVPPSNAAPFTASGTIYTLQTHDSVSSGADADWFSLVGVTSVGTCPTGDGGYVVFMLRDDANGQRMFSLAPQNLRETPLQFGWTIRSRPRQVSVTLKRCLIERSQLIAFISPATLSKSDPTLGNPPSTSGLVVRASA